MTLRKRVSGIDETIRRPVVIEAQRIRCSLFVRVPAAKNGAETVGVSNPDRVPIQAHTSLFRAALARLPLRVSTFISRPDADAIWRYTELAAPLFCAAHADREGVVACASIAIGSSSTAMAWAKRFSASSPATVSP